MGTHGLYGFIYKGRLYLTYCHYDGYLEGLGINLMREIKHAVETGLIQIWKQKMETIRIVNENDDTASDDEIKKLLPWTDVSSYPPNPNGETKWYWLLHKCQGSFVRGFESGYLLAKVETNAISNPIDEGLENDASYVYVLNFDKMEYSIHYTDNDDDNIVIRTITYDVNNLPDNFMDLTFD